MVGMRERTDRSSSRGGNSAGRLDHGRSGGARKQAGTCNSSSELDDKLANWDEMRMRRKREKAKKRREQNRRGGGGAELS